MYWLCWYTDVLGRVVIVGGDGRGGGGGGDGSGAQPWTLSLFLRPMKNRIKGKERKRLQRNAAGRTKGSYPSALGLCC